MIDRTEIAEQLEAILRANRELLDAVEAIAKALADEIPELRRKQMRVVASGD